MMWVKHKDMNAAKFLLVKESDPMRGQAEAIDIIKQIYFVAPGRKRVPLAKGLSKDSSDLKGNTFYIPHLICGYI